MHNRLPDAPDTVLMRGGSLIVRGQAKLLADVTQIERLSAIQALADVEQWMAIFAVEHIINNFDSWGHDIGKNCLKGPTSQDR